MEPNQPNLPTQQVPPVTPSKHLNLLPTIIVGILMLLIGLGGGYLLFANKSEMEQADTQISPTTIQTSPTGVITPTIDPTADWKTYTNSQYGYSIKYPSTVAYKQDRFYLVGDENRKDTADGFGPELEVLFRGDNLTPLEAAKQELQSSQFENFEINNATGVQVVSPSLGAFDYYVYPKSGSGNVIRLVFNSQNNSLVTKESMSTMQAIAVQMISTFKFTQ